MRYGWIFMAQALVAAPVWAGLVLVREGRPRAVILTSIEPSDAARQAARELQNCIYRTSCPVRDRRNAIRSRFSSAARLSGRISSSRYGFLIPPSL